MTKIEKPTEPTSLINGYTIVKLVEKAHRCERLPNSDDYGIGTIIECGGCKYQWEIFKGTSSSKYWRTLNNTESEATK